MEQADLLFSGIIVTALILSVWAGALLTATCIFFAPSRFSASSTKSPARKP
jgi:hypothetical protein